MSEECKFFHHYGDAILIRQTITEEQTKVLKQLEKIAETLEVLAERLTGSKTNEVKPCP